MIVWIDAQSPRSSVTWLADECGIEAHMLRDVGLKGAEDIDIFQAARRADAVLLSKDHDFVDMVSRQGPPPRLIWLTCGNLKK